jgi:hypothetical protein
MINTFAKTALNQNSKITIISALEQRSENERLIEERYGVGAKYLLSLKLDALIWITNFTFNLTTYYLI